MMLLGNINAIPFRRRFGGGSGVPFPYIPGMIARYSGAGLTNEDMSTNPVWKDLMGNGYDLQMKNFGWAGMSGVNGYVENFNQWFVGVDESNKTVSDSSMKLVLLESDTQKVIYDRTSHQIGYTYNFYIKVTGIEGRTLNVNAGTLGGTIMSITEDGIYSINATVSDSWGNNMLYLIFPPSSSSNTVTIEQLPLYPGALVFDGVDDYGVCDNFPILTKESGYTVIALRNFLNTSKTCGLVSKWQTANNVESGAFLLEGITLSGNNIIISFGNQKELQFSKSPFTYMTSKDYNRSVIPPGSSIDKSSLLTVGTYYSNIHNSYFVNAAIWEICILDHDATEEELQKIQDYYKQEYPWLFPDQAWTVTGKTNEDTDRATIANITGNGNNLVLSNLGFIEGSGYNEEGEYAGYLVTDGVDDKIASSAFEMGKDFTVVGEWKLLSVSNYNYAGIVKSNNLYVYNSSTGINIYVCSSSAGNKMEGLKSLKAIRSDGRVYDENWTEYKLKNVGDNIGVNSTLDIGTNKNNFTKIAFKNLEIYNNKILSKEDCIKAYNYLQTLKAK